MEPTIQILLDSLEQGFKGVHSRLDTLNGKVYRHERDIAVLQNHTESLRARTCQLDQLVEALSRLQEARQAIDARQTRDLKIVGAVLGGLMGGLSLLLQVKPTLLSWLL